MITREDKLHTMFVLQDELNEATFPGWKNSNNKYTRAAVVECVELMNWLGWEWWKNSVEDVKEVNKEFIDIFHFMISHAIKTGCPEQTVLEMESAAFSYGSKDWNEESEHPLSLTEDLMSSLLMDVSWSDMWFDYFDLGCALRMGINQIYPVYLKKYALNKFRQMNGYKEGTYIKQWGDNEEDNTYLELIENNDIPEEANEAVQYILGRLQAYYERVLMLQGTVSPE